MAIESVDGEAAFTLAMNAPLCEAVVTRFVEDSVLQQSGSRHAQEEHGKIVAALRTLITQWSQLAQKSTWNEERSAQYSLHSLHQTIKDKIHINQELADLEALFTERQQWEAAQGLSGSILQTTSGISKTAVARARSKTAGVWPLSARSTATLSGGKATTTTTGAPAAAAANPATSTPAASATADDDEEDCDAPEGSLQAMLRKRKTALASHCPGPSANSKVQSTESTSGKSTSREKADSTSSTSGEPAASSTASKAPPSKATGSFAQQITYAVMERFRRYQKATSDVATLLQEVQDLAPRLIGARRASAELEAQRADLTDRAAKLFSRLVVMKEAEAVVNGACATSIGSSSQVVQPLTVYFNLIAESAQLDHLDNQPAALQAYAAAAHELQQLRTENQQLRLLLATAQGKKAGDDVVDDCPALLSEGCTITAADWLPDQLPVSPASAAADRDHSNSSSRSISDACSHVSNRLGLEPIQLPAASACHDEPETPLLLPPPAVLASAQSPTDGHNSSNPDQSAGQAEDAAGQQQQHEQPAVPDMFLETPRQSDDFGCGIDLGSRSSSSVGSCSSCRGSDTEASIPDSPGILATDDVNAITLSSTCGSRSATNQAARAGKTAVKQVDSEVEAEILRCIALARESCSNGSSGGSFVIPSLAASAAAVGSVSATGAGGRSEGKSLPIAAATAAAAGPKGEQKQDVEGDSGGDLLLTVYEASGAVSSWFGSTFGAWL